MAITAAMVRELREMTGAAMMDCKKALGATDGDLQAAVDHLRKQGMKSAAKKASRETGEGRIFSAISGDGRRGHLVGVACETDFLAKGDLFVAFVDELTAHVASQDPDGLEDGERPVLSQSWNGAGPTVSEKLQEAVGQLKENIKIERLIRMENSAGLIGAYVHHDKKQGAIVSVTTGTDVAKGEEVLKGLCQHIVVNRPAYAQREEVPADAVERERAVIAESDEVKSKPENIRDKIIEGKLGRFYAENVLADQPWIHDDKSSVAKALVKELGEGTRIERFERFVIG